MCRDISALLAQLHPKIPNTDAKLDTIALLEARQAWNINVAAVITAKRVHLSQHRVRQEGLC